MRIERVVVASLLLALATPGGPARGQEAGDRADDGPSLFLVNSETTVGSLRWSFASGRTFETSRLAEQIALRGPGSFVWLRRTFDFLPGVSTPAYAAFSPIVLQRDVARLRRFHREAGFPSARVDYDVALDTAANRVDIRMIVDQGPPLLIDSVAVRLEAPGGGGDRDGRTTSPSVLPGELEPEWNAFVADLARRRGTRFGRETRARLVDETTEWFLRRGYPWASARVEGADTTDSGVRVRLSANAGTRARVGAVRLEGQERLSPGVLLREIPIRVGDWYDVRRVAEGERELFELDLVRQALGDIAESQPGDSSVVIRYRVNESRPRLIWGRVGWRSESGFGGETHWQHRDFLGGARTLTVSTSVESGWGELEEDVGVAVGVSALVRQPYFIQRTMAAGFGPFVRFRDDARDRSLLFGVESSLFYRKRALEAVTLQHELSRLRVDNTFQLTPLADLVAQGDSAFGPIFVKSVFRLTGAYGTLDDRINPTAGYLVEPSVEATAPSAISDVEFVRLGMRGMAVAPVGGRATLFVRGSAGRIFPFGASDPETGASRTRAIVGLRDVMFTAGGTSDVRGWGTGLMGSKIPDIDVRSDGTVTASRYVPAGGLARLTGGVELGLPFPLLADPHRTFLFVDAGRVWSPGETFDPGDEELRREGWAYSTGGGLEFGTLVGPIRFGVGYKLNPAPIDLLSPSEVANAIVSGVPLESLDQKAYRRWHLHLSIGRSF